MKRLFNAICLVLATVLAASCLNTKEEEYVVYNDTAITAFSLGTLNRYDTLQTKDGKDSIVKTLVSCSNTKFVIDQLNHQIYNPDSLPMGVDVEHTVCSVTSKNGGLIVIKKIDSDTLNYYVETDSIDFSVPREFRVYPSSNDSCQRYTVRVNVHQEDGNAFNWQELKTNSAIGALKGMKALAIGKRIFVFGLDGDRTSGFSTTDGKEWTALTPNINATLSAEAYRNMVASADSIYLLDKNVLYRTTDGQQWHEIGTTTAIDRLIGANHAELYGMSDNDRLMVSRDGGCHWQEDLLDASASLLPTSNVVTACYAMNQAEDTDYMILAGQGTAKNARVWRKIVEYDDYSEPATWAFMDVPANRYELPLLAQMTLVPYDDGVLAVGVEGGHFAPFYQSRDNGITWKESSFYQLPTGFSGSTDSFAVASDGVYIWFFGGVSGQVWRGKLNRLDWK